MKIVILSILCLLKNEVHSVKLSKPSVYVVTPLPKHLTIDEARSAPRPFYYHNWIKRLDSPANSTTATVTTTTPKVKTPDLIFAEFENDDMKNIKKLLERERIVSKISTTPKPIYVLNDNKPEKSQNVNYEQPSTIHEKEESTSAKDMTDYFAIYNNVHTKDDNLPAPVFVTSMTSQKPIAIPTTTSESPSNYNVQNIWHIIDSQRHDQYSDGWDEQPLKSEHEEHEDNDQTEQTNEGSDEIDENFALPGFGTNPPKVAENESRAIRTEPNIRFPYVNLKPFQMKNPLKAHKNSVSKKGNNMYTSLDNFSEIKNPVRGEAQDTVPIRQPIERYNPAQPYLPAEYGSKSKQSKPYSGPVKAVGNLVPPPPPPVPKVTADDFPSPSSYESFPPYAPGTDDASDMSKPALSPDTPVGDDDDSNISSGDTMDLGYRYKPRAPPGPSFLPTVAPLGKPFDGYSYSKPIAPSDPSMADDKPDFDGYNYDKPAPAKPMKPDTNGYHYQKPEPLPPVMDHPPAFDHGPPVGHVYPDLIFDHSYGGKPSPPGGDVNGDDDMGMVPPPMPDMMKPDSPPMDDSGFPHDFPGDLKFHHNFDDHDFYHYHHHHPTTTTTTTEMPRVNRFSYYYLGKKLYYLPLYFSVYFIVYVGALIIKAVLRHKIVYPNSYRPNDTTATFFTKRSIDSWNEKLSNENLHKMTRMVTHAIAIAAERYMNTNESKND